MWREIGIAARRAGILAGIAAAIAASPAAAQSPICADLQSQYLAAFGSGPARVSGRSMVETDRISRELSNAQMAARQGNCNRFLFFGPRPSPQCPAIMATISRLQQQLAQARSSRSLFVTSPEQERQRLRAWLQQNGCELPQAGGGGQRTICVRTCDGYFFPISFSTSSQRVSRDAEVCQSMYAEGGQAEIFSHTTNHDVADARSASGQRYGDQPYAFLFRRAFFATCAGQLKDGVAALGERYWEARGPRPETATLAVAAAARPQVPMPNMRPVVRQEDPETLANRRGQLAVAPHVAEDDRAIIVAGGRTMRLVGDPYYADLFDPAQPARPITTHRAPLGFDLIGSAMAATATDSDDAGHAATEVR